MPHSRGRKLTFGGTIFILCLFRVTIEKCTTGSCPGKMERPKVASRIRYTGKFIFFSSSTYSPDNLSHSAVFFCISARASFTKGHAQRDDITLVVARVSDDAEM